MIFLSIICTLTPFLPGGGTRWQEGDEGKEGRRFFVTFLHTDPVFPAYCGVGLNWNMGDTLTGNMGYTACSAF